MPSSYIQSGEATSIDNITGLGTGIVAGDLARPIFATTATAAGTTTLTVASASTQEFTGSTTQTVTMPAPAGLVLGWSTTFINKSTGNILIESYGADPSDMIVVLASGQSVTLKCRSIAADSTPAAWDVVGLTPALWLSATNENLTASNATETDLTWADTIGNMTSALGGPHLEVFTAPVTGKYTFRTLLQYEASAANANPSEGYFTVKLTQSDNTLIKTIRTGGVLQTYTTDLLSTGTDTLEWTLPLTAGDTVKHRVTYTDGGNGNDLNFYAATCQLKITQEL